MKLRDARKLHNGDQVILKDTGQVVTVIRAYPCPVDPEKYHCIEAMTGNGFLVLSHLDVH